MPTITVQRQVIGKIGSQTQPFKTESFRSGAYNSPYKNYF